MRFFVRIFILVIAAASLVIAKPVKNEKKLIKGAQKFVKLIFTYEKNYDVKLGILYDNDADVIISRYYPDGLKKSKKFSGKQIRLYLDENVMKYKKDNNERFVYSKIKYKAINPYRVKVTMLRKQYNKKVAYKYSLIVGLNKKNQWKIFEEKKVEEPL